MGRPRPVPSPGGLVLKNGSKMLASRGAGMPGPVSAMALSTPARPAFPARDDVEGRPDLVGEAAREAAGDGQRGRMPELLLEVQRPLCLQEQFVPRRLKLIGHRVEGFGNTPELVPPLDR